MSHRAARGMDGEPQLDRSAIEKISADSPPTDERVSGGNAAYHGAAAPCHRPRSGPVPARQRGAVVMYSSQLRSKAIRETAGARASTADEELLEDGQRLRRNSSARAYRALGAAAGRGITRWLVVGE